MSDLADENRGLGSFERQRGDDNANRWRRTAKDLLISGVLEETRRLSGSYLFNYLNAWPEDTRSDQLRRKLLDLKAAHRRSLEIIDGLEDG